MRTHNPRNASFLDGNRMRFKRKDGLFEYDKNLLNDAERDEALKRLAKRYRVGDDVRRFMNLPAQDKDQDGRSRT